MSVNLIIQALGGATVIMPTSLSITRADAGTPAEIILDSDGYRYQRTGATLTQVAPWISPLSAASLYEVRSTLTGGTFTADPSAGSWVSLSSQRLWSRGASVAASQTVTATIEIRNASTLAVLSSTALTLTCDRT